MRVDAKERTVERSDSSERILGRLWSRDLANLVTSLFRPLTRVLGSEGVKEVKDFRWDRVL